MKESLYERNPVSAVIFSSRADTYFVTETYIFKNLLLLNKNFKVYLLSFCWYFIVEKLNLLLEIVISVLLFPVTMIDVLYNIFCNKYNFVLIFRFIKIGEISSLLFRFLKLYFLISKSNLMWHFYVFSQAYYN